MSKRIIITGISGFIGKALGELFAESGYEVIGLTRSGDITGQAENSGIRLASWDARTSAGWSESSEGAYAIVNLAGENVGAGRWTKQKKQNILDSRIEATRAVIEAVKSAKHKPNVVIQTSAIGYYGNSGEQALDEESSAGGGFLADVCRQTEQTAELMVNNGVRLVIVRIGVVLGLNGGMLARLLPVFRKFLGGCPGPGQNWLSWVHIHDLIGAIKFLIEKPDAQGVFNLTAPNPVRAKYFYQLLGEVLKRPVLMPMPAFILKLLLGDMASDLLLAGQKALPKKLVSAGYQFRHSDLETALRDLLNNRTIH